MPKQYRRETSEFYEAMPATMDSRHLTNEEAVDRSDHNILPWLLVPALALLAIILLSYGSNANNPSGVRNLDNNYTQQSAGTHVQGQASGSAASTSK